MLTQGYKIAFALACLLTLTSCSHFQKHEWVTDRVKNFKFIALKAEAKDDIKKEGFLVCFDICLRHGELKQIECK